MEQEQKQTNSTDFIKNIKNLDRDENGQIKPFFTANNVQYKILQASEGIPISRWGLFKKYSVQAGTGLDFQTLYKKLNQFKSLLDKFCRQQTTIVNLSTQYAELEKSLLDLSTERFDNCLYLCSLFIVKENEDLTKWTLADADKKIQDWIVEGLGIQDFFLLATSSIKGCNLMLNQALQNKTMTIQKEWQQTFTDVTE